MSPLTRPCFLLLLLEIFFLLAFSFLHCGAGSSNSCSCSDPSFLDQDGFLLSHDLMIWTDDSVPFPFGKDGYDVHVNSSLCAAEATHPFRQAQFIKVFPLKPAPFCKPSAGLGSTNMSVNSLLLSSCQALALSSRHTSLSSVFPLTSNSLAHMAGTVFSLLHYYQATMGSWSLVSSWKERR